MNKLLEKINKLYSFYEPVKLIRKVKKGYLTNNFVIGNSLEKYFLKQYSDDILHVKRTHLAKSFFAKNGIPVIVPMRTKSSRTFFEHERLAYALFPYVEGYQYKKLKVSITPSSQCGIPKCRILKNSINILISYLELIRK